jgi:hypothetical protein
MTYKFTLPMFQGSTFQMEQSNLTGKLKLFKDAVLLEQSNEPGKPFLISVDNKKMIKAYPKIYLYSQVLEISGKRYRISKKLTWYEYLIAFLPLLFGLVGSGFLNSPGYVFMFVFLGLGAVSVNIYFIFSQEGTIVSKYLKVIGIIGLCLIIYYFTIYGFSIKHLF